jgi:UDP-N-acetylmuramoyl-L-alanyl-D-glutamate--2,6-diaminopimelate ligase
MQTLHTPTQAARWLQSRVRGHLRADSRQVQPGDGFVAWPGAAVDGRRFAATAMAQGAAACLLERDGVEAFALAGESFASYPDLKSHTGPIAAEFYGSPSQALDVVAVTGTNGKTSTAWLLAQALSALPHATAKPCGVIGTLGVGRPAQVHSTGMTTPDPALLQRTLRALVDEGFKACAIEASSIGVEEHRLDGTLVRVAVFTNFTQDHLDYHGSMAAYGAAKRALFDTTGLKAAVLNVDDAHGHAWAQALAARPGLDLWTVSRAQAQGPAEASHQASDDTVTGARLQAREVRHTAQGLELVLHESGGAAHPDSRHAVRTALIGDFNVENLLVVAGCLRARAVPLADVALALGRLTPVPGRLQRVPAVGAVGEAAQPAVVVDYAHTPDALEKALQALAPLARARGGQLWCVFGCGGDRDATKRPLMGQSAVSGAAHVVVTSDNPRSEDPARILAQVMAGAQQAPVIAATRTLQAIDDRRAAIVHAVCQAAPEDVVLIAGKGHEQTQEIAGVKHPFCDVTEATAALRARGAAPAAVPTEARP